MTSRKKHKSPYSVHPSVSMVQTSVKNLHERTGLTIEQWVERLKAEGPPAEKDRREWLKKEFGIGTNYAGWIAERAEGRGLEDSDPAAYLRAAEKYVDTMFSGAKAQLLPLYAQLLDIGQALGGDVKICPCQTIVPFYRRHVFAQIKPSTKTRIDFGFSLMDLPASGKLIDTGGYLKKDRITHRIPVCTLGDLDDEFMHYLKMAYDMDV